MGAQEVALLFCILMLLAVPVLVVLLVVLLVRRSGGSAPPLATAQGELHLSVLAVGLEAAGRARVEEQLAQPFQAASATQLRVLLVQRLAATLRTVQPAWRFFGYGEKDLGDLAAAEQSYLANVADFRARSAVPGDPHGTVAVLTLVVALRGAPATVTRLDDPRQLLALLEGLAQVDAARLLGAEALWAPPAGTLTEASVGQRFPEMQRLSRLG